MENKIRREARRFLQKQFIRYDPYYTGAIQKSQMSAIIKDLLKDEPALFNKEELETVIEEKSGESTFMVLSKGNHEFVLGHEDGRLDFPSVMEVTVHFLKKVEKKNNDGFVCKHLIRLNDFPTP